MVKGLSECDEVIVLYYNNVFDCLLSESEVFQKIISLHDFKKRIRAYIKELLNKIK